MWELQWPSKSCGTQQSSNSWHSWGRLRCWRPAEAPTWCSFWGWWHLMAILRNHHPTWMGSTKIAQVLCWYACFFQHFHVIWEFSCLCAKGQIYNKLTHSKDSNVTIGYMFLCPNHKGSGKKNISSSYIPGNFYSSVKLSALPSKKSSHYRIS